jgi:hypothetical protein
MRHSPKFIYFLLLLSTFALSQTESQEKPEPKNASVTFRFLHKQMHPARYEILLIRSRQPSKLKRATQRM